MTADKPKVAFHELDLESGWEPVPGGVPGLEQKILSGALDEARRTGVRTRLIRDYWEEVYLIEGNLEVGGRLYRPASYACRPPGTPHGPFRSETGCLFFEIQYYG